MLAKEVLQFVLYLNGVELGIVVEQTFGKALRRVAGECAQFKYATRLSHAHEHLQQAALQMPRTHARVEQLDVRVAVELVKMLRLGVDML